VSNISKKLDPKLRAAIVADYPAMGYEEIADKYGFSTSYIGEIIRASGVPIIRYKPGPSDEQRDYIHALFKQGVKRKQIVELTKLSVGSVNNVLYADKKYRTYPRKGERFTGTESARLTAPRGNATIQRRCSDCRSLFYTTRYVFRCSACHRKEELYDGRV
jgi:hypothetical protein